MNYKSYPKKKDTPSRTARKHARSTTFQANRRMGPARRKAARLARREMEQ